MADYFGQFVEIYRQTTLEFGVADIFADDSLDIAERVGSFVLLMNQATLGKEGNHVNSVLVVTPPIESTLVFDQLEIERTTRAAAESLFKRAISEQEQNWLSKFVTVFHTKSLGISSLIEALRSVPEGSVAIVICAALYRMDSGQNTTSLPSPPLPEDIWIPHLCDLAARSVAVAKERKFYLLLDTGESAPQRPENYKRITAIQGCGFFAMQREYDSEKLIAGHIANWKSLTENGQLGSAFASIDALPAWMDSHKSFLKLQLMESIVPDEEILRLLHEEESNIRSKADARAKLKLARIAERSNDDQLSAELLTSAIDGLTSAEDLLLAADLAKKLGEFMLAEQIIGRGENLFPHSSSFLDQRLRL